MDNKRKYLESHPWVNFKVDLSRDIPFLLWILLGATESKCKHLTGIPLSPQKQQQLNKISLVRGVHATTAIEGNSLSEEEVAGIMNDPQAKLPKSKTYQETEVRNVVDAYNKIINEVDTDGACKAGFGELLEDNKAILDGLDLDSDVVPGKLRTHAVVVNRYRGAPAEDCEYLLRQLFDWLCDEDRWVLGEGHELISGILKAITAHLYIAWIHPFGDGNGRSARMLEFRLLMAAGVPLNAAHLLTTHYNKTRTEYYNALSKSSQSPQGDPVSFFLYALQGFADALDGQIKEILEEQLDVTWINFVHTHEYFGGALSTARARQKELLLALSKCDKPVSASDLKRFVDEKLWERYDKKTPKTFTRDLNELCSAEFVLRNASNRYVAAKRLMKAFLPLCKRDV